MDPVGFFDKFELEPIVVAGLVDRQRHVVDFSVATDGSQIGGRAQRVVRLEQIGTVTGQGIHTQIEFVGREMYVVCVFNHPTTRGLLPGLTRT